MKKLTNQRVHILVFLLLLLIMVPANLSGGQPSADMQSDQSNSVEERRILDALRQERNELMARERLLNAREMELNSLQVEVDKKLNELRRMREEVEELVAQVNEEENARILNLSKMYEKMEPAKAAEVLATLKTELAVKILANMKQKSAGKILNNLDDAKAATLSVAFSKLRGATSK
jgi:flagellar motility protein MotE (MotC chaperone)